MQFAGFRDPYGAALRAIRRLADTGRFAPGQAIVVTELAAEVGYSPTPVREALACLAGEGLIERRRGKGYFFPALTAPDVIDLFELQLAYLHAAVALYPRGLTSLRKAAVAVDPQDGVQALFDAIVRQSANRALTFAHQRLNGRLLHVLRKEQTTGDRGPEVVRTMIEAIVAGKIPALLQLLDQHHERRCAQATDLVEAHPEAARRSA